MNVNLYPKAIVDMIRDVVNTTSLNVLNQLKAADKAIQTIHYEHGHPTEIVNTLNQLSKSPTGKFEKYPIIMLFQDFDEVKGNAGKYLADVSLHIVIASSTDPTYKAADRYAKNFNPILYPLYYAFIKYLSRHPMVVGYSEVGLKHIKTDRLYWGKTGLYGNAANVFNDYLDAIELKNVQLRINYKNLLRNINQID